MNEFSFDGGAAGFCPDSRIVHKLAEKHIGTPTAVQKAVMPVIYEGANCIFESETGTGKTFAYLLPLLQRLYFDLGREDGEAQAQPKLIIAAPTKELAAQIKNELHFLLGATEKILLCFGGSSIKRQIEGLKEKPFALVGSANRLSDLIRLKRIKTAQIKSLVFDEADRLLAKEMKAESFELLRALPKNIQFIACSATVNENVRQELIAFLEKSAIGLVSGSQTRCIALPKENVLTGKIAHWAIYAEERDKADTLRSFLAAEKPAKALVFCATNDSAEKTAAYLNFKKVPCFALHADTDKVQRKQALDKFKNGSCSVLVSGDLAARGLDIPDISHVIQLNVPSNPDFFVHRAGRTGRSDKTGINLVIGDVGDLHSLAQLEKKLKIAVYPKELYEGKLISADDDCC